MEKSQVLKSIAKTEDKLLISKIIDKAEKAIRHKCYSYTDFLDPYQRNLIEKFLMSQADVKIVFNGGYEGAERVIAILCPDFMLEGNISGQEVPLKIVQVKVRHRNSLSHRDFLGALMSLGIKREKIGDILVKEDFCSIVALSDIADYINYNLLRIGKFEVENEVKEISSLQPDQPKVKEINTTIASLRVDCVASAGFGISRTKIAEFIKAEKLNLNWEMTNSLTRQVKEGDTISIKGKGRVVLETVGRTTKKGRIGILLKKYI